METPDRRGWLFRRLLSLTLIIAWWSLWRQVLVLIGHNGLMPAGVWFRYAKNVEGLSFWDTPSLLRPLMLSSWAQSVTQADQLLRDGCLLGIGLGALALLGVATRWVVALSAVWYLSYAVACRGMYAFQWDNLLLEACLLTAMVRVTLVRKRTPAAATIELPEAAPTPDFEGIEQSGVDVMQGASPRRDSKYPEEVSGVILSGAPRDSLTSERLEALLDAEKLGAEQTGKADAEAARRKAQDTGEQSSAETNGHPTAEADEHTTAEAAEHASSEGDEPPAESERKVPSIRPKQHSFADWRTESHSFWHQALSKFWKRTGLGVLLFRVLLFKLYFLSGLAKLQSQLGDWLDGSAMTFYYETAPLPTPLAWYANALPEKWHNFESWFTLGFELLVPFAIFTPRTSRHWAFGILTGFQVVNILTANYGFFCYLALALHVFLLDAADLDRVYWKVRHAIVGTPVERYFALRRLARAWKRRQVRRVRGMVSRMAHLNAARKRRLGDMRYASTLLFSVVYIGVSADIALRRFVSPQAFIPGFNWLAEVLGPYRVINNYHLFSHITRERIEPEFQTEQNGTWTAQYMHYKPGELDKASPYVAPYQPRVDFRLWFYGLNYEHRMPGYVQILLHRLCDNPKAVQDLFVKPLPHHPEAVRVVFWRYTFTTPQERDQSGNVWNREPVGEPRGLSCTRQ